MRRLWLIFAQACTIALALLFVVTTLRPEWLSRAGRPGNVVLFQEQPAAPAVQVAAAGGAPHQISYAEAVKKAIPSVVNLYSSKEFRSRAPMLSDPLLRRFFGQRLDPGPQKTFSLGSGVIVSAQGYILTNNHVVEGADTIDLVMADGRKLTGKIVGTDPDTDIAVLKVTADNLPAITLGNDEQLQVGDPVLAIGNPFGVTNTVTSGIVSALGRNRLGINEFENFIQTDAAINPGNSGGALIDRNGNLIGINTAIYSRTGGTMGIGFAIPISLAKPIMEQIIQTGQVTRGYMGVVFSELTPQAVQALDAKSDKGVLIREVVPGSPAERAGLKSGDIVVGVNGKSTDDAASLRDQISALLPGSRTPLRVARGSNEVTLEVEVAKRPRQPMRAPEE
ncbi:MAG: Do family serine endopeptidase [Betaproteobacteria bacterium]|nr:Do family serine endopeptidase [Betaproteobacteria bacterium]